MAKHSLLDAGAALVETVPATTGGPTVVYPDGSGLARPLSIPKQLVPVLALIAAVALVIGGLAASRSIDSVVNYREHQRDAMQAMLTRGVTVDPPRLADFAGSDAESVIGTLAEQGTTVINVNDYADQRTNELDLMKMPADMTAEDGIQILSTGVNRLSAPAAVQFLTGSWRMTQRSLATIDKHVRYADFTSRSAEDAINAAIEQQGFDPETVIDEGVDSRGNTYKTGTISLYDLAFTWTVSCCPLDEVYDVDDLPAGALYVGVRLATGE